MNYKPTDIQAARAAFRFLIDLGFTCESEEEGIDAVRALLDTHNQANELRALQDKLQEKALQAITGQEPQP